MISIILDTNVFISGIFWSGPPYLILDAWRQKKIKLIYSVEILEEYLRISKFLSKKYKQIDIFPFIDLVTLHGELHTPIVLENSVTADRDDDKFIACALGANCNIIISGDKDLLTVNGYAGIEVLKPVPFLKKHIKA